MAFDYTVEKFSENEVLTPDKLNQQVSALEQLKKSFNTSILESDGITAKKATYATNAANAANADIAANAKNAESAAKATNVTASINGKAVSGIFESNGTTVKKATVAEKTANGLTLQVNESATTFNGSIAKTVSVATNNPNLFLNGDFKINQRGLTQFTYTSGASKYSVDRWCMDYMQCRLTVSAKNELNIYSLPATAQTINFQQKLEPQNFKKVGDYTVRFKVSDPNNISQMFCFYNKGSSGNVYFFKKDSVTDVANGYYTQTFVLSETDIQNIRGSSCQYVCVGIQFTSQYATPFTIYWAKLEEGNISTAPLGLARSYGEELALCQRYYVNSAVRARAALYHNRSLQRSQIYFPCPMRITPTITKGGGSAYVDVIEWQCKEGFMFGTNTTNECTLGGYQADAEV